MPKLINSITGSILNNYTSNVYCVTTLSGEIQSEDYVNMGGLTAYLQNFTEVNYIKILEKPLTFGLKNQYNLPTITLEIAY